MAKMDRCLKLYHVAMRADRAYTKAIKRAFGPRATRWTVPSAQQNSHPAVRRAYNRMVAMGNAQHRACVVGRRR